MITPPNIPIIGQAEVEVLAIEAIALGYCNCTPVNRSLLCLMQHRPAQCPKCKRIYTLREVTGPGTVDIRIDEP